MAAQGKTHTGPVTDSIKAIPSPSHMALVKLQELGILKYLISQNCDGLHRKSGMLSENLSELHGNTNLETCSKCKKEYLRDYDASADYQHSVHDHRTGRKCDDCGGDLLDSIINFSENLPQIPLERAIEHSKKSDLMLVLGSSLTVSPANSMPKKCVKSGGKLVIVNMQRTPLDEISNVRVFAKIDNFMRLVMNRMALEIPTFLLHRRLKIEQQSATNKINLFAQDVDGKTPHDFIYDLKHLQLLSAQNVPISGAKISCKKVLPYKFQIEWSSKSKETPTSLSFTLQFMGNYNEVSLAMVHSFSNPLQLYALSYNPMNGQWKTSETIKKIVVAAAGSESKPNESNVNNNGISIIQQPPPTPQNKLSQLTVRVGNLYELVPGGQFPLTNNQHKWTMFANCENVSNENIRSVEFNLHPTFFPSRIVKTQAPFTVQRVGWGTFLVGVKITMWDGFEFNAQHYLKFESDPTTNGCSSESYIVSGLGTTKPSVSSASSNRDSSDEE